MVSIQAELMTYLHSKAFLGERITLNPKESLTGAGIIDSIGLIQLIDYIEERYHIQIPLEMVTPNNFDTLEGIERIINKLSSREI